MTPATLLGTRACVLPKLSGDASNTPPPFPSTSYLVSHRYVPLPPMTLLGLCRCPCPALLKLSGGASNSLPPLHTRLFLATTGDPLKATDADHRSPCADLALGTAGKTPHLQRVDTTV
jgi:hypothetical protein